MRIRKWMTLVVAFAMAFTVIGFGLATDEVSAAVTKPTKITLTTTAKTIDIKGKATVSVKSVSPSKASKSVTWKSSNTKIATVSSKGVVTGKKTGKVKITATSKYNKKVKKSITITVKNLKPTITLPSSKTVYTGIKYSVKATVPSKYYNAGVVYKIGNTKYATVSPSGKATTKSATITPKSKGTTTLTAYSKESSKIKDTCKLTVKRSITKMWFNESVVEIEKGKSKTQIANHNDADVKVVYTSSNTNVATVNKSTGEVTAVGLGTAKITATPDAGYKKTASYTITVYEVLDPVIEGSYGTYTLDKTKYNRYVVSATRNEKPGTISLNYGDIDNILGFGNCGFDWMNVYDVEENFADAEFSYVSGTEYEFSKKGNKITTIFGGKVFIWYYNQEDEDSFVVDGDNYTITMKDGSGELKLIITRTGNTVKVVPSKGEYGFTMVRTGSDYSITVTAGDLIAEATFVRVDKNIYTITFDKTDIEQQKVEVKAY